MENNEINLFPELEETQPQQPAAPAEAAPVEAAAPAATIDAVKNGANAAMKKVKALPKTLFIGIGAAIAAVVAIILAFSLLGNSYKSPVKLAEKSANQKTYVAQDKQILKQLNGLCTGDVRAILNIRKKADDYKDSLADDKESFKDTIEDMKEEYGNNYKYTYKIEDKEKLEKEDLREVRDSLDAAYDQIKKLEKETKDWDSDDWEDLAEELGISKNNAKKLLKNCKKLAKKLSSAKVTAGYELEITRTLKGSELDEPEETEITMTVYKVNGRWVSYSALMMLMSLASGIGF